MAILTPKSSKSCPEGDAFEMTGVARVLLDLYTLHPLESTEESVEDFFLAHGTV